MTPSRAFSPDFMAVFMSDWIWALSMVLSARNVGGDETAFVPGM
jgi:hypothetical protein